MINKANSESSKYQPYTNKKREKYQIDGSCKTFKDQLKMWKMRRLRQRHEGQNRWPLGDI